MINVQLASSVLIVPVCFIHVYDNHGIFLFVCFAEYTQEHDIKSSWICQYTPAQYYRHHHQKKENAKKTREIKRKVQQEEYRQISGHATISIKIVRVCTMIVYGSF
jgi:hypothetical protein